VHIPTFFGCEKSEAERHTMTHEGTHRIFWKKKSVEINFFVNFAFTETPLECGIITMFSTNYQP